MKIAIGIVSYLPYGENRYIRLEKLNKLLKQLDQLFGLQIFIVAQNWQGESIAKLDRSTMKIYSFNKALGITGARKYLRKVFLESDYDYLIMLDDDSQLSGDQESVNKYIKQIVEHPDMYGKFKSLTLQLFAISKYMYSLVDFPDLEAANGDFFEDMWFIMYLEKKYKDKEFVFIRNGLNELADPSGRDHSTWFHNQFDKHKVGDATRAMIRDA